MSLARSSEQAHLDHILCVVWKLFRGRPAPPPAPSPQRDFSADSDYVIRALKDHHQRLLTLEANEATREAQHAAQLDALARLYKRVATRIAREAPPPVANADAPSESESVLAMRRRLGR